MNEMEANELRDEYGAQYGDPRRCKRHGTVISSPDGMFDGLCGHCEMEADSEMGDGPIVTKGAR